MPIANKSERLMIIPFEAILLLEFTKFIPFYKLFKNNEILAFENFDSALVPHHAGVTQGLCGMGARMPENSKYEGAVSCRGCHLFSPTLLSTVRSVLTKC